MWQNICLRLYSIWPSRWEFKPSAFCERNYGDSIITLSYRTWFVFPYFSFFFIFTYENIFSCFTRNSYISYVCCKAQCSICWCVLLVAFMLFDSVCLFFLVFFSNVSFSSLFLAWCLLCCVVMPFPLLFIILIYILVTKYFFAYFISHFFCVLPWSLLLFSHFIFLHNFISFSFPVFFLSDIPSFILLDFFHSLPYLTLHLTFLFPKGVL